MISNKKKGTQFFLNIRFNVMYVKFNCGLSMKNSMHDNRFCQQFFFIVLLQIEMSDFFYNKNDIVVMP